jgi:hypothetical protein
MFFITRIIDVLSVMLSVSAQTDAVWYSWLPSTHAAAHRLYGRRPVSQHLTFRTRDVDRCPRRPVGGVDDLRQQGHALCLWTAWPIQSKIMNKTRECTQHY